MSRGAFDFVTKPVDLSDLDITVRRTPGDIARVLEIDRRGVAAELARANLAPYFSPNLVDMLAEPLYALQRQTVAVLSLISSGSSVWPSGCRPNGCGSRNTEKRVARMASASSP
jgi:hypothetical protein